MGLETAKNIIDLSNKANDCFGVTRLGGAFRTAAFGGPEVKNVELGISHAPAPGAGK